ncbi:MAG: hypothetical protein QME52_12150 [Bacteroidota bacterium]|nr:hypothetical protein [Bacteroidota bacterium]
MNEAGRVGVRHAAEGHPPIQESLFDDQPLPEWVEVNIRSVCTERSRRFGDVWLALELIKQLGLNEWLKHTMAQTNAKISWATLANVLIVSRFCEPSSELHIAEQFYRKSALSDLLGIPTVSERTSWEVVHDQLRYPAIRCDIQLF